MSLKQFFSVMRKDMDINWQKSSDGKHQWVACGVLHASGKKPDAVRRGAKLSNKWQNRSLLSSYSGSWTREINPMGGREGYIPCNKSVGAPVPLTTVGGALWVYYHGGAWAGRQLWIKSKNINCNRPGRRILLHSNDWPSHRVLIT